MGLTEEMRMDRWEKNTNMKINADFSATCIQIVCKNVKMSLERHIVVSVCASLAGK